jgi:hypothetical protein
MDVPDNILNLVDLLSETALESGTLGENAAKISIPGALISGWSVYQIYVLENQRDKGIYADNN